MATSAKDTQQDVLKGFDFYNFDEHLTEQQIELRDMVRHFVNTEVLPHINPYWEKAEFPWEIAHKLKELPIMGGMIPVHGGAGLNFLEMGLVMYELAKSGFTQSYTYFAWRDVKWELEQYYEELHNTRVSEFFRPNSWPNTPDILTDQLQTGLKPMYLQRLVLAGTLTASWGMYGPTFELMESRPRGEKEEYLDNEKYEIRDWDLDRQNIREYIRRVNLIRRENPALQHDRSLRFHGSDNDQIMVYSKWSHADGTPYTYRYLEERPGDDGNLVLVVINLDPRHTQSTMVHLPLDEWGIGWDESFEVHDLMSGSRYVWRGGANYVELNPHAFPAHIFRVTRQRAPAEEAPEAV